MYVFGLVTFVGCASGAAALFSVAAHVRPVWPSIVFVGVIPSVLFLLAFDMLDALFPGPFPGVATHSQEHHLHSLMFLAAAVAFSASYLGVRRTFRVTPLRACLMAFGVGVWSVAIWTVAMWNMV